MDIMNNGYAICLNEWIDDERIKNELRLLLKISSLTAEKGYCYASNEYFSEHFKITTVSVSRKIKKLIDSGYIEAEYVMRGAEVKLRKLRLTKMLTDGYQKCYSTVNKNVKDNNTSNNNTSKSKRASKRSVFKKPTLVEVKSYIEEKNFSIDPNQFVDFFEASDWIDSNGKKVLNWKQKLLTWNRYNTSNKQQSESSQSVSTVSQYQITKH